MSGKKDKELLEACERGGTGDIGRLIKEGASVNCTGAFLEWTPLHYAARYGHTSDISILISLGAELEARDSDNRTPLHHAAIEGHASAISLLISHGAQLEVKDCLNRTPLLHAAIRGHASAISLLISHGAQLEVKDCLGWTPLHNAAADGRTSSISALISHGAQTEATDDVYTVPNCAFNGLKCGKLCCQVQSGYGDIHSTSMTKHRLFRIQFNRTQKTVV